VAVADAATQAAAAARTNDVDTLTARAKNIRRNVVRMASGKGEGYVGQGLDAADILAVLFLSELRYDPADPDAPDRDRFLLSPGHYSIALWATYAEAGILPDADLASYGADGSPLIMSTHQGSLPGVDLTGGSLSHGIGVGAGIAAGRRMRGSDWRTFVFMSDGELQEGSTWEGAMFAAQERLSSLVVVVDCNRTQADGPLVLEHEPLVDKFRSFGWWAEETDGHDIAGLLAAFARARTEPERPKAVICHTRLGYGVPLIMNRDRAHFVRVGDDEWQTVARELEDWE
jgi:transketolase